MLTRRPGSIWLWKEKSGCLSCSLDIIISKLNTCVVLKNRLFHQEINFLETSFENGSSFSPPSLDDLPGLLQKCRKVRDKDCAQHLCTYMLSNGIHHQAYLANLLILTLLDVGCLHRARLVFDQLAYRNVRLYNNLISTYVKYGKPSIAFSLYNNMLKDDLVQPNGHTFVALMKACGDLKDLQKVRELHAEILRACLLDKDVFVGSTLVDMYLRCGTATEAHEVFLELPIKNVVSWTTIIKGYVDQNQSVKALQCFEEMQLECVIPDTVTYVCGLKACGSLRDLNKGQEMHVEAERLNLMNTGLVLGNTMLDMYTRCGSLNLAREIFDHQPIHDEYSWTVLIAGYVEQGYGDEALSCFQKMKDEHILPDSVTFIWVFKACASVGDIEKGQEVHTLIERRGLLVDDVVLGNSLIDMYAKCGLQMTAQKMFDRLPVRNTISWNTLIEGFAAHGQVCEALKCYEQMKAEGVSLDILTFCFCLKACGSTKTIENGEELHCEIERHSLLGKDISIGNMLIDMYVKCGCLMKAQEVFEKLPMRNVVSWNALIEGYSEQGFSEEALNCFENMQLCGVPPDCATFVSILKACGGEGDMDKGVEIHGKIERLTLLERNVIIGNALMDMYAKCGIPIRAQEVFDRLLFRDIISWNSLINGYTERGQPYAAIKCFEEMKSSGLSPDPVTFICILKACSGQGMASKGMEIHVDIERMGILEINFIAGSTLIDMYAKSGSLEKAQEVFDKLPKRNIIHWNLLLAGYTQIGESEMVFQIFDRMIGERIKPSPITFVIVLNACSRLGLFDRSQMYYEMMCKEYDIIPTAEHLNCVVDVFCRSGQLDNVFAMIEEMPENPDLVAWHTVLAACKKSGSMEFAKQAFENAVHLDQNSTVAYVLMSQIYADVKSTTD